MSRAPATTPAQLLSEGRVRPFDQLQELSVRQRRVPPRLSPRAGSDHHGKTQARSTGSARPVPPRRAPPETSGVRDLGRGSQLARCGGLDGPTDQSGWGGAGSAAAGDERGLGRIAVHEGTSVADLGSGASRARCGEIRSSKDRIAAGAPRATACPPSSRLARRGTSSGGASDYDNSQHAAC